MGSDEPGSSAAQPGPREGGPAASGHTHLWPCWAISMARRAGTGEPPSVTLSTSMDLRSGRRLPCRFSIGESTRFRGGSEYRRRSGQTAPGPQWGSAGRAGGHPWTHTYLVPGGQVLILLARVPFFPVQEEEVNHLLLVLPTAGERRKTRWHTGPPAPPGRRSHPRPRAPPGSSPRRTPRTAGPAAACCGLGSSPVSACCPARRGRCPPGWAASGSAPCEEWAALVRAHSCPLCGHRTGHPLISSGRAWAAARVGGPPSPGALHPATLPVPSPGRPPASCPHPAPSAGHGGPRAKAGQGLRWAGALPPPFLAGPPGHSNRQSRRLVGGKATYIYHMCF